MNCCAESGREPAITALLNGHAVKVASASTSVTCDARIGLTERAGAARAGKASPDHDDTRSGPLPERRNGEERRAAAAASFRNCAAAGLHFCAAYQAAMAWISASVNPLAIRSMTVPVRVPARKSWSAFTIAA